MGSDKQFEEITPLDDATEHESSVPDDEEEEDVEGFDFDNDLMTGAFDPMVTIGQFITTQQGETIPDVLEKINSTLNTLNKVLHKISKTLDKKV